jgi:hypothetical protein
MFWGDVKINPTKLLNHNPPLLEEREHSSTSKGSRRLDKPAAFGVQF